MGTTSRGYPYPSPSDPVDVAGDIEALAEAANDDAAALAAGTALNNGAVTAAKLATDAVETAKIKDANVTEAKLATGAVTEAKIGTGAVTEAKIADGAVTSAKIADGTIVNADINASAAIARTKIDGTPPPSSLTITAGTGLTGGGDLSANRTLAVSYGTTAGTAAQGDDARITGAVQSSLVDAKGDLLAGTANDTVARLAVGANNQVLVADSAATAGVKWANVDTLISGAGQYRYTGFAWYDGDAASPDTYFALGAFGADAGALSGNTGYTRQTTGVPVDAQVQSRMRRCVVKSDGTAVNYYLDCDNSAKIAGTYTGGVQTGWVRVHEGVTDPVTPIPGQATTGNAALRTGIPAYSASAVYSRGDRVTYDGKLWDSLSDANTGITPAAGTTAAVLTGTDGQVMVEIPRFYWRETYDPIAGRATYAVACDTAQFKPFPDLTVASTAAATISVGGVDYAVHPAFVKAGVQRPARYIAAYRAVAENTGNNTSGTLKSIADGSSLYTGSVSLTNFRAKARNNNVGLTDVSGQANDVWHLLDYHLWHAVQVLYLTEYRTFYAQAVLGGGNNVGGDYAKLCGRSNPLGNATGNYNSSGALVAITTGDTDGVAYRGIEDLYGSQWAWVDGWNINHDANGGLHYVSNTPAQFADGTSTNYTQVGGVTPLSGWHYAKSLHPGTFILAKTGGGTTTYTTDGFYGAAGAAWVAALVGGNAACEALNGVVAVIVNNAATLAVADVGAVIAR